MQTIFSRVQYFEDPNTIDFHSSIAKKMLFAHGWDVKPEYLNEKSDNLLQKLKVTY
jgi:hypothetical protein